MKKYLSAILVIILLLSTLIGCNDTSGRTTSADNSGSNNGKNTHNPAQTESATAGADLGDTATAFGDDLEALDVYKGYFEENLTDVTVKCVSGTAGCYKLEGNTLTFTNVSADSVYSVTGKLKGNIIIDIGDDYKFDLELQGLSLVSDTTTPITILSGDEVSVTAKSGYDNYIYDKRETVAEEDTTQYSGAIYSKVDLEICGKGSLTVVSDNNNGIHGKNDLQVKNLTLLVACIDNALKGNDSVEISEGNLTLIATQGDGIKTTNSDISSKGNQRGTVTIAGGTHTIYAACDGIDAAYNAVVDDSSTVLNIYTDKYSNYSKEVTAVASNEYYIRFNSSLYQYSIKYYNSDEDYQWVTAEFHSKVTGMRTSYYYYSVPKMPEYEKIQFFMYSSDMTPGQEEEYLVASDYLTPNTEYDTFALTSRGNTIGYSWTNYTTSIQEEAGMGRPGGMGGPGGMNEGNPDKSDYSTKGIKAGNEVIINAGTTTIKAYDDAIHANCDTTLENGENPTGNVTINGGAITVYSNDDGIHADGTLTISNGMVSITNSYEGLEGTCINISGGNISVISSDDGINGTTTTDTAIAISGGTLYIYCTGDGIDSNSRTSYSGIVFSGGNTVVISNSSGNSAIDTERGYQYTGGSVVAIMPSRGMTSEATLCTNFADIATNVNESLTTGKYLTVSSDGSTIVTIKIPANISAKIIYLGDKSASISTEASSSVTLDSNGVCWNK